MKDQIRSARIALNCSDLNATLEFYVKQLGFRLEMITPADEPTGAVISGYGIELRLEESKQNLTTGLTLYFFGDFTETTEINSPDGIRILLVDEKSSLKIPEGTQELVVTEYKDKDSWNEGRAGMHYSDLIPSRLGGRFIASHIKIPGRGAVPDYVHYHKIRFQMIYCISGWARLVYEDQGEPFIMKAGDCVLQPPEIRHRVLESGDDLEVLEIGCPAIHETWADSQMSLPNERFDSEKDFSGQKFVRHIAENAVWEKSEFYGVESRNTGIDIATSGLADVRVFRSNAVTNFKIDHSGEFLFVFVLKNELRLSRKSGENLNLTAGGCFVLPANESFEIESFAGSEFIKVSMPSKPAQN